MWRTVLDNDSSFDGDSEAVSDTDCVEVILSEEDCEAMPVSDRETVWTSEWEGDPLSGFVRVTD